MSKLNEIEEQISDKSSMLSVLKGLTEHVGWKYFHDLLENQANSRKGEILLKPLASTEAVYAQEFMKGEISGLTLAQVGIFAVMEGLKHELQVFAAQLEQENELEKARADDAGRSRVDGDTYGGGSSKPSD